METFHYEPEIKTELEKDVLRTAAYCRVSTLSEDQLSSYETQQKYYQQLIEQDPKKILVGIYADRMSGLHIEKRTEFQRMLTDAREGKIDVIITRSVSRFSRNMGECVSTVNQLKAMGIPVIFEKEHINSLDPNAELLAHLMR